MVPNHLDYRTLTWLAYTDNVEPGEAPAVTTKGFLSLPPELLELIAETLVSIFDEDALYECLDPEVWGRPRFPSQFLARLVHPSFTPLLDVHLFDHLRIHIEAPHILLEAMPANAQENAPLRDFNDNIDKTNMRSMQVARQIVDSRLASCITYLAIEYDGSNNKPSSSEVDGQNLALFSALLHATANKLTELHMTVETNGSPGSAVQGQLDLPARFPCLKGITIFGFVLCSMVHAICERAEPLAIRCCGEDMSSHAYVDGPTPAAPWPPLKYVVVGANGAMGSVSPRWSIVPQIDLHLDRCLSSVWPALFTFIRPQPLNLFIQYSFWPGHQHVGDLVRMLKDSIDASELMSITFRNAYRWGKKAIEERAAVARELRLALMDQWRGSGVKLVEIWAEDEDRTKDSSVVETVM